MTYALVVAGLVGAAGIATWLSLWMIRENESGLVVKKFGRALPPGRIVAAEGEAGFQSRLLAPGWHFGLWRWRYRVVRVPMVVVPQGQIALVVAADGAPIPPERILAREVPCDDFQDAEAFLRNGGEKGRQLAFLTAGTYRINPALFRVITAANADGNGMRSVELRVREIAPDRVGVVTVHDGRPIPVGDLAGHRVPGHHGFQRGQAFLAAGGCRGLQEEVLLSGTWNLNPWFVTVEEIPMTEVPIGHVGVVVSYVGREHTDITGDSFTHGDLVEPGGKGVWAAPLLPGKHPINTRVMKTELVPTTNIVLNWANRTEAHLYDEKLSSISVRSKDGFHFSLDVSQIIHVGAKNAPRVISRVGSVQNLVDHVLQPVVGNYFRNSAQEVTVLEFLSARSDRQKQAYAAISGAIRHYDVECIDTLIGDIVPPAELMKTQTDRKIADESRRTYEMQMEAQVKRQALERETAVANLQAEVVRSEQTVRIAGQGALARAETARGEANAVRLLAQAEADATRATGAAKAEAYRLGVTALGGQAYTALQVSSILAEHQVKLVPEVAVGGDVATGLVGALLGRMLENKR